MPQLQFDLEGTQVGILDLDGFGGDGDGLLGEVEIAGRKLCLDRQQVVRGVSDRHSVSWFHRRGGHINGVVDFALQFVKSVKHSLVHPACRTVILV